MPQDDPEAYLDPNSPYYDPSKYRDPVSSSGRGQRARNIMDVSPAGVVKDISEGMLPGAIMDLFGREGPDTGDRQTDNPDFSQGEDLLSVLDEAAGRPLDPSEIEEFLKTPEGNYVLQHYTQENGVSPTLRPYIMEAFDTWARTKKTVPTDLMTPQTSNF